MDSFDGERKVRCHMGVVEITPLGLPSGEPSFFSLIRSGHGEGIMEQSRVEGVEYMDHAVRASNAGLTKLGPIDVETFAMDVRAKLRPHQRSRGQQIRLVITGNAATSNVVHQENVQGSPVG